MTRLGFNWYEMHTIDHQNEGLLTIPEVATRLSVSTSTVRRLVSKGEIPAVRLGSSPASSIGLTRPNWTTGSTNRRKTHDATSGDKHA